MDRIDVLGKKLKELERKQDFGKYPEYVNGQVNAAVIKLTDIIATNEVNTKKTFERVNSSIMHLSKSLLAVEKNVAAMVSDAKKLEDFMHMNIDSVDERIDGFELVMEKHASDIKDMVSANKKMRESLMVFLRGLPDKIDA